VDLIRRVFELDPILCPCGRPAGVTAFITRASSDPKDPRTSETHSQRRPRPRGVRKLERQPGRRRRHRAAPGRAHVGQCLRRGRCVFRRSAGPTRTGPGKVSTREAFASSSSSGPTGSAWIRRTEGISSREIGPERHRFALRGERGLFLQGLKLLEILNRNQHGERPTSPCESHPFVRVGHPVNHFSQSVPCLAHTYFTGRPNVLVATLTIRTGLRNWC